jgi:hypothetical protein
MIEDLRLNAGFMRAQQSASVRPIRNDHRDGRRQLAAGDRIDDRLQV